MCAWDNVHRANANTWWTFRKDNTNNRQTSTTAKLVSKLYFPHNNIRWIVRHTHAHVYHSDDDCDLVNLLQKIAYSPQFVRNSRKKICDCIISLRNAHNNMLFIPKKKTVIEFSSKHQITGGTWRNGRIHHNLKFLYFRWEIDRMNGSDVWMASIGFGSDPKPLFAWWHR